MKTLGLPVRVDLEMQKYTPDPILFVGDIGVKAAFAGGTLDRMSLFDEAIFGLKRR